MTAAIGFPKPASRLQDRISMKHDREQQERTFKLAIWIRDGAKCRKCHRKVQKSLARIASRGEKHHGYGRIGALRYAVKSALLLCLSCHEQLTGRVAEKWCLAPMRGSRYWTMRDRPQPYLDLDGPVTFQRVV